jgi:TRAP-type C4-dicarboxylate transport system substrate-binding protein
MKTVLYALLLASSQAFADAKALTVATIIPDGTPGAKVLKEFSKQVETETKGDITFKFKWGGNAGADQEVLSKLKTGELSGAMLAGQIMDRIAPIVRTAEIPFQFAKDRGKAHAYIDSQKSNWERKIVSAGFHPITFYDVGFVYLCGIKSVTSLSDIKGGKVWLWPGDKLGRTVIEHLDANAVEIEVKDSFKALSDGRIEFAYAPAIAVVALQWYSKAKHLVAEPISFAAGSFLLSDASWKSLPPKDQTVIANLAKNLSSKLNDASASDEKEALEAMTAMGVKITSMKSSDSDKLKSISKSIQQKWKP